MRTLLFASAFIATAILARSADAQDKPRKPVVCLAYSIAKTESTVVAICHDGKKPALLTRFEVVEVPGREGGRVKVLVGWR